MKISIFFLFFGSFLLFSSCNNKTMLSDCADTICTLEFRTITINITNANVNPVALDSFKVIHQKSGNDLTREVSESNFEAMRETGTYPLFEDEYLKEYQNKKLEINFQGYIDGEKVLHSAFEVGANCCHVYHISGDLDLKIE